MSALYLVFLINNHIITKIIKTEFIVGTVGYIGIVSGSLILVGHSVNYKTYRKPHKAVKLSHPFGISLCKVIVYRYNMNALPRNGIKICRKGSNQGFTFTCLHFGNSPLMQNDTAQNLNGEMSHTKHSVASLSASGKSFGQQVVERFSAFVSFLKFVCFVF